LLKTTTSILNKMANENTKPAPAPVPESPDKLGLSVRKLIKLPPRSTDAQVITRIEEILADLKAAEAAKSIADAHEAKVQALQVRGLSRSMAEDKLVRQAEHDATVAIAEKARETANARAAERRLQAVQAQPRG
jgi:hypothetical protein